MPERRMFVASGAITFLCNASLFVCLPVLAPFLPSSTYAAALTMPQIGIALGSLLCGVSSDRYGRRRALVVALAIGAFAALLCAWATLVRAPWALFVGLMLLGASAASTVVAQASLLAVSAPSERATLVGRLTACAMGGIICGPLAGGLLFQWYHETDVAYTLPFLMTAACYVAAAVAATRFPSVDASSVDRRARRHALGEIVACAVDGRVRGLVGAFFLMEVVLACFYERMPIALLARGATPLGIGIYGAYIGTLIAATCVLLVPFLERSRAEHAPVAAFAVLAVAGMLLIGAPSSIRLWCAGVPLALGAGTIYCFAFGRLSRLFPADDQGTIAGVASLAGGIAFPLAALVSARASTVDSNAVASTIVIVAALGGCVSFFTRSGVRAEPSFIVGEST